MLMLPAIIPQIDTVHHCRAEDMLTALPSNYVDLIVTSPPYDNLRSYKGFSWDFEYIARQSYRVLKTGGVLVWVVSDSVVDGSETLSCFEQALFFRSTGFLAWDTMIWRKLIPGDMQKRYNHAFEYMFVLSKGEPSTFNAQLRPNKSAGSKSGGGHRRHHGAQKSEGRTIKPMGRYENVWDISVGPQSDPDKTPHPAKFPQELAERHILTWSNPGDIVLDYFGGSGTTAKMARIHNRRFLTNDISKEYCGLMEHRLAAPYTPNMFEIA